MDFNNYFNIKSRHQKEHERREAAWGFAASNLGFFWDCLKVVFKPMPDEDQGWFDFLMEKLGSLVIVLICGGLLAVASIYLLFPMIVAVMHK